MNYIIKLLSIIIILGLASCDTLDIKETQLEDLSPSFKLHINGQSNEANTFDSTHYNYTWVDPTSSKLISSFSEIRSEQCTNNICPNSLGISFVLNRDSLVQIANSPSSTIAGLELDGSTKSSVDYDFNLSLNDSTSNVSICWKISENNGASKTFTDVTNVQFTAESNSSVGVNILITDNNTSALTEIHKSYSDHLPMVVSPSIEYEVINDSMYITILNHAPEFLLQVNGDLPEFNIPTATIAVKENDTIRVAYIESNRDTSSIDRLIEQWVYNSSLQNIAGFGSELSASSTTQNPFNQKDYIHGFYISYTDKNSETWMSETGSCELEILHASPFVENENGQSTILVDIDFAGIFFSSGGAPSVITGSATFAIPVSE